jgi:hypothetical protein
MVALYPIGTMPDRADVYLLAGYIAEKPGDSVNGNFQQLPIFRLIVFYWFLFT